jgi:uncharacterized protein (TIGR01777 family)
MRVFLTGGTGFIGSHLVSALIERGHHCVVVSRGTRTWNSEAVELVKGDPTKSGPWQKALATCDAVINLAGAIIVDPPHRWTEARKAVIRKSRVETTHCVVDAIHDAPTPPKVLVSSSAIGYYGSRGDRVLDETAPPGDDFLARLCVEWEEAARAAEGTTRVTLLRTAPVIGRGGGVLSPMLPAFRLGLGGAWGPGTQWWSWIHVDDVVGIIFLALERELPGALNVTAPVPVSVTTFTKTLADVLHRPAVARVPDFALRLGLGEAAEALLASLRVVPRRVLDAGYTFRFSELRPALADVV